MHRVGTNYGLGASTRLGHLKFCILNFASPHGWGIHLEAAQVRDVVLQLAVALNVHPLQAGARWRLPAGTGTGAVSGRGRGRHIQLSQLLPSLLSLQGRACRCLRNAVGGLAVGSPGGKRAPAALGTARPPAELPAANHRLLHRVPHLVLRPLHDALTGMGSPGPAEAVVKSDPRRVSAVPTPTQHERSLLDTSSTL